MEAASSRAPRTRLPADSFAKDRVAAASDCVRVRWAVFAAMFVGIAIALFQALTQVQEITLTFIPKIVVILVTISFTAAFMGAQIGRMTEVLYGRISTGF